MEHTIWAKIPDTYNLISLSGQVYTNGERPGILKGMISNHGYVRVQLLYPVGYKHKRVHRLVMEAFGSNQITYLK